MGFEVLIPIFGILIVLVPIVGLTTVLTLRLGLKPFVVTLAEELRGTGYAAPGELQLQIADLTEQLTAVTAELRRLQEAHEFDRRLAESAGRDPAG